MAKLYQYVLKLYNNGALEANVYENDVLVETEKQYVYKTKNDYYSVLDKKTYDRKDNTKKYYYDNGIKCLHILPHITAMLYAKTLSKANEKKIKSLLEKAIQENFGFTSNLDLENIEFKKQ